ncbi:MAG TPA: type II toxin-antitoxin system RelE/ParE family toxin [Vitreimonas sp.]|uniref:type II toxin-antitoxin system RelE/ParE family toxin n=1 Tax=Vitreimonas sp. TaxID=3069702 RepID=UPI002D42217E|nr:type II toxin-antitoxin system RelE/ParE family toxin [Vitreimonas sp.]HYD88646.1 type II toxin-antitoxin system RelE/ParE family toxin [Vitreimonas sp.]
MRRVEVAAQARADIRNALAESREHFGAAARHRYDAIIRRAQKLLQQDPKRAGVQQREDLPPNYFLFHLRHARTRAAAPKHPRHFILFRFDDRRLYILRVLHDAMDIEQNVSADENNET